MRSTFSPALSGALAMIVCGFLWSLAGLFIKVLNWNPFLIAGLRSLIAFLFLFALVGTVRLKWSGALLGAALANAATMLLFVAANKTTTAANAILLQYLAPVFTALFSVIFLKEHLYREQVLALFMTMVGMVVLFLDRLSPGQLVGNLMALTSAFTFSLMFIFTRMQKEGDPLQSFMASHAVAALVALTVAIFLPLPPFTTRAIGSILVLGVVQIGLAAFFFSYGIKRVSAVTANLLAVIEPVFNPVWVFLVLGEAPTANTLVGGVIILGSVTLASLISARRISKYT
ncbi:DMT family transporter [Geomonas subterranea]|uniref:DMT family transporter n=1 Tax=Geomonas subterranea TaxID=2847989 RepID=A0ABX8LH24_9BACT|nr:MULTISPECIES: DMT family transporter [Geomonas]QXE90211.1 DMT family transporter [Geomonas subterranea]QXM07663.1 DMT family transporter [Geomonas subterranea]